MTGTSIRESPLDRNPQSASRSSKPTEFLNYIHNFRGFAILVIVAAHIISSLEWNNERVERIVQILVGNGTVYFVFIAGFLFQFLSHKYEFGNYLSKKVRFVLLPYFFVSIPAIALCIADKIYTPPDWYLERFADWTIAKQIEMYFVTGAHLPPLWFIPMIVLFYLVSPALIWVDRTPKAYWILPTLLIVTAFVPRPVDNGAIQSFVHFLSVYLFGMFCSRYRDRLFPIVERQCMGLIAGFLALTALEFWIYPSPIAINSLSKLVVCLLIIYALWRSETHIPKSFHTTMGFLAQLSFGIFFLHDYFIIAYFGIASKFNFPPFWTDANPLTFLLVFSLGVGASVGSIVLLKKILGKYSRFVVGS
jgi:surface polysaccharide O-acyltransferase-like enzyme